MCATRTENNMFGFQTNDGHFRCSNCIDFSSYRREANANDLGEQCAYCKGPVVDQPGFIETEFQREINTTADALMPNWDVRFTYANHIVEGTIDAVDPLGDRHGRIGVYVVDARTYQLRKYRVRPERPFIRLVDSPVSV
ncbi:hypothetical protein [Streptomyces sp. NPDC056796]|uniref:hypothetical protein n=1 Tax=Streptomyces sp. NPDC056796 TaxID=3345947 RepID=UPI003685F671